MDFKSFTSKNKNLIIAITFMIINTVSILAIFNTEFFQSIDTDLLKARFVLIAIGICMGAFFITLKYLKSLSTTHLLIIFIITRLALLTFFIMANYALEMDFYSFGGMAENILDGKLFTPYWENWLADWWRMAPPMWMWWYTFNYIVYGLDPVIWSYVNILLEVGIVYVMIKIFEENSTSEKGFTEDNFKIGLSFYIFSIFPIYSIVLSGTITALPVLLGLLGFLFYFRSKTEPKNIYIAVFFFSLCALSLYFGAIWILGILLVILFRKEVKRFIILCVEVVGIFCYVCLPMLINDARGFLERLIWQYEFYAYNWNGSVFANELGLMTYIPAVLAICFVLVFTYQNYNKEINLDYFIIILAIFLFFSPHFAPWYYLWIFPVISITIIYSFRKYFIANLFFIGYFFIFMLLFAIAALIYPSPPPGWPTAWTDIQQFMMNNGFFTILQLIGHLFYYCGFIYLIYSYTSSKNWIIALLVPLIIFYAIDVIYFL